jgi:type I restriction enzyme S subunit
LGEEIFISKTEKGLSRKGFGLASLIPKDSVLFVCIGSTIGKVGIASEDLASNQQINSLLPSDNLHYLFAYYLLRFQASRIKAIAGEHVVPQINKSQFKAIRVLVPDVVEQKTIASILFDMDKEIDALKAKRKKYVSIKKAMAMKLLSGEVRLKDLL